MWGHMSENQTQPWLQESGALSTANGSRGLLTILQRVRVIFDEVPDLALTIPQAARLWRVDAATAEDVLAALVDIGYLCVGPTGFMRTHEERSWRDLDRPAAGNRA